jgi:transposase
MLGDGTEFIFVFNDPRRADAAAEAAQSQGYTTKVVTGDGEGRHVQLRLSLARAVSEQEFNRLEGDLRQLIAKHRGRYEGGHYERVE